MVDAKRDGQETLGLSLLCRARDLKTEEIVALKKVKMVKEAYKEGFPRTAIREMNILVQFHHPNIVNVSEVVVGKRSDEVRQVQQSRSVQRLRQ